MRRKLTRDELRNITGRAARHTIIRELEAIGVPFELGSDGWPVVDERAYDQTMGVKGQRSSRRTEAVMDLGAI